MGSFSSLVFSFFSGTGFSCPGSGSGFGTSTILTGGFGSGSRLAALKAALSRIGISGTRTVVAQAATVSATATVVPSPRCDAHLPSPVLVVTSCDQLKVCT